MKAIIFSAGLGTRIQSISKGKPKALVSIHQKPLIEYAIEYLLKFGIESMIVNVHHQADMLEAYIRGSKYASLVSISDERDLLLDTGGGLLKAQSFFDGEDNFVALNVDVLTDLDLKEMMAFHLKHSPIATLAVRQRATSRYLLFDRQHRMVGWENRNTQERILHTDSENLTPLAFSGVHILSSKIWKYLEQEKNKKFSITPAYIRIAQDEKIMGFEHQEGFWFDVGKSHTYQSACEYISRNK